MSTADRTNRQGRAKLPCRRFSRGQRDAYHEAGHAVMAFYLRRRVVYVSTVPPGFTKDNFGRVLLTPIPRSVLDCTKGKRRLRAWAEREVMILCAGGLAVARLGSRALGNWKDIDQALRLLSHVMPEAPASHLDRLNKRAKVVFNKPGVWRAVQGIAAELAEHICLTGRQARLVYQAAMEEGFSEGVA